jgi:hypothetical protein
MTNPVDADPLGEDTDPGNLAHTIDESFRENMYVEHRAIDGTAHVLPEDVERVEADRLARDRGERPW